MKNKRTITIAAMIVALAIIATIVVFRDTQSVKAQDTTPPPIPDRISFGMVGITSGQTVRVSVSDTLTPNDSGWPPGPSRVVMAFRNANGQLVRNRSGEVVRRVVDLERGDTTSLDFDFDQWPPGPTRVQLRAVATILYPPGPSLPPPTGDRICQRSR